MQWKRTCRSYRPERGPTRAKGGSRKASDAVLIQDEGVALHHEGRPFETIAECHLWGAFVRRGFWDLRPLCQDGAEGMCMGYAAVCGDGVFWPTPCEVEGGRSGTAAAARRYGKDQWVHRPSSVYLAV